MRRYRKQATSNRLKVGSRYRKTNLVFCHADGTPVNPSNTAKRQFPSLCEKAEVPLIRFHDLRHTHATILLVAGIHPKVVSERLGHSSVRITLDTYSHVLPSIQRDAADALDKVIQV